MLELLLGTLMLAAIGLALREHERGGRFDDHGHDPESYRHIEVSVYEPVLYLEQESRGRSARLPSVLYGPRPVEPAHEPHWEHEPQQQVSQLLN